MKKNLLIKYFLLILITANTSVNAQRNTMYVNGRYLYSAASEKVILRGINEMYYALEDKSGFDVTNEMAKSGANSIRIAWSVRQQSSEAAVVNLDKAISNCIQNKMIPIVMVIDATGMFEKLDTCIDFWLREDVKNVINKHKKWVILNIANEAGNVVSDNKYKTKYKNAIVQLRGAGIDVPLLIDAAGFGGNVEQVITCAKAIQQSDNLSNTFFSCHTYWNDSIIPRLDRAIAAIVNNNLPIIFGESPTPTTYTPICNPSPYKYFLEKFNENEISWLAWSWGKVTNNDCNINGRSLFDITVNGINGNWLPNNPWAIDVMVNSPYSIKKTSVRPPSFFSNTGSAGSKAEAENGTNTGVTNSNTIAGFSGTGYVDGGSFNNVGDNIKLILNVSAGTYQLNIRYNGRFGEKQQDVYVNGNNIGTIQFAATSQWSTKTIPNINLLAGNNTIDIRKNWGWMDVDYVEAVGTNAITNLKLEAETGSTLVGVQSANSIGGYSGTGYIEGSSLNEAGDLIKVFPQINTQGNYSVSIKYNGRFGEKYQDLYVNNTFYGAVQFPASIGWASKTVANIYLNAGNNIIELRKNWGWMDVDFFEINNTTIGKSTLPNITKAVKAELIIKNIENNTIFIDATNIVDEKENAIAKLYNVDGKLLQQWVIGANQKKLIINEKLNTGIYIIQILSKTGQVSKKIMIQ